MSEFNKPPELRFDGDVGKNFREFKSQVEIYFFATETNIKSNDIQVARLLNLIGAEGRNLIANLNKTGKKIVKNILGVLEIECVPRKNEAMSHFKLFTRFQKSSEPFDSFYRDLRCLVAGCDFGLAEMKIIRSQIVLGANNHELQQTVT